MRARTSGALLAATLALGCGGLRPPVQNSGPSVSHDGVQVAVTRQGCTETVEPDQPGNDLVEAILEVRVRNAAAAPPLTVRRDGFRLLTPDGHALETVTFHAADPLVVEGGADRTFELRFMTRGSLACARAMTLEARSCLTVGDRPVAIGGVRIVPWQSL